MIRNEPGQKIQFYSEISGVPNEGDAENITVMLTRFGEEAESTNNAVEIGGGTYELEITKEETNCPVLTVTPASTTEDAEFIPASVDYRMYLPGGIIPVPYDDDKDLSIMIPIMMAVANA